MKKTLYFAVTALAVSSVIFACKKKKDDDNPPANVAPTAAVTFPVSSTYLEASSDSTITIKANASDSDGSISKVEFYINDTRISEDNTSPYEATYLFHTNTNYTIKVVATDDKGAFTTSTTVSAVLYHI